MLYSQHKNRKEFKLNTFEELDLNANIKRAITDLGYVTPSPIQALAYPILLAEPTDFIGLAATGTGKTAAFGIPLLNRVEPAIRDVQGLILCPTRELALQVSKQIDLMGKYIGVKSVAIYGGASYGDQIRGLKQGASIVVATPGRLVDHVTRGTLNLKKVHTVILDEADEMISMGFKDDLETILKSAPRETSKIWLFSATMSSEVRRVADKYLRTPKVIQVNRTEVLSATVEQLYYATRESNKPDILCKIIDAAEDFYGLVFCQTKALVVDLTSYLSERGYKVDNLHGDKDQRSREATTQAFRDRRVQILICTDVASRGLDVKDVSHVINYSIPRELDSYVHRIGRTARSGKKGTAISLVTPSHRHLIGRLETMTKSKIKEGILPTRKDIGSKKVTAVLDKFNNQGAFSKAMELLDQSWKESLAKMTAEEVASRFLMMNFPDLFAAEGDRDRVTLGQSGMNGMPGAPRGEQRESRGGYGGGSRGGFGGGNGGSRGSYAGGSSRGPRGGNGDVDHKQKKTPPWKRTSYASSSSGGAGGPSRGGFSRPKRQD